MPRSKKGPVSRPRSANPSNALGLCVAYTEAKDWLAAREFWRGGLHCKRGGEPPHSKKGLIRTDAGKF
jgi:hypothetical protein